jgi:UDP-N-acetylmuramate--alanine ligase
MWVIVEPHSYSRTKALLSEYKGVFSDADKVVIGPIFKARDKKRFKIGSEDILKVSEKKGAVSFAVFTAAVSYFGKHKKPGDVVLVMGAGKSYLWAREVLDSLE